MDTALLKKLAYVHSVTGDTEQMRSFIISELTNIGVRFHVNSFGTIIVGSADKPKVMFASHIDQVGFQVTKINEDGSCNILPIGWVVPNRLDHTPIYVMTKNGEVCGAVFHNDLLKSESVEKFSDLKVYFGTTSKGETESLGIGVGDFGSFKKDYYETHNAIFSSGVDNVVSIFVLLEEIKRNPGFLDDVIIAFHDDEEMQDHGANSLCYEYSSVEYACILDYCPVHHRSDEEDVFPNFTTGPFIVYRGGSHILHPKLKEKLEPLGLFKAFFQTEPYPVWSHKISRIME